MIAGRVHHCRSPNAQKRHQWHVELKASTSFAGRSLKTAAANSNGRSQVVCNPWAGMRAAVRSARIGPLMQHVPVLCLELFCLPGVDCVGSVRKGKDLQNGKLAWSNKKDRCEHQCEAGSKHCQGCKHETPKNEQSVPSAY